MVNDCPTGLEPSAGARNRIKATVKEKNTRLLFLGLSEFCIRSRLLRITNPMQDRKIQKESIITYRQFISKPNLLLLRFMNAPLPMAKTPNRKGGMTTSTVNSTTTPSTPKPSKSAAAKKKTVEDSESEGMFYF